KKINAESFEVFTDPRKQALLKVTEALLPQMLGETSKKITANLGGSFFEAQVQTPLAGATAPLLVGQMVGIHSARTILQPYTKIHRPALPAVAEAIEGWRRGEYSETERNDILAKIGFTDKDIEVLIEISWATPSVQDLITMAVREVFTPDVAERFGIFEGFEEVANQAESLLFKAGIRPETLKLFWGAHWELPSVLQGFEMLHRDVIEESDLDLLLRAKDVMPFWRDKIKAIAFSPFTRVDLRRMHKFGVLNEKQLFQGFKDIGFDAEKAATMVEFTLAFNADDDDTNSRKDKNRDLTRSDVLRIFRDGLMGQKAAEEILASLGFDPLEIQFLIEREIFLQEEDKLKKTLTALRRGFLDGVFSENDLVARLGTFNLPTKMTDDFLEGLRLELEVSTAIPSKSEILRWFKKELIDETKTRALLEQRSFRKEDIDLFIRDKAPEKKT
ncbi:hypothetical protein LCGC14_2341350, partial [marine sediment metagenome]